jgi:hypothetical protein
MLTTGTRYWQQAPDTDNRHYMWTTGISTLTSGHKILTAQAPYPDNRQQILTRGIKKYRHQAQDPDNRHKSWQQAPDTVIRHQMQQQAQILTTDTIYWQQLPNTDSRAPKVGAVRKKVSTETIPILFYLEKISVKRLYCSNSQKFWAMKRYKYFYAKNLNQQSDCIISNSGIFQGEVIQVFLGKKIWINEAILFFLCGGGGEWIHRFHLALKG